MPMAKADMMTERVKHPPHNGGPSKGGQPMSGTVFSRHFTAGDRATRATLEELVISLSQAGLNGDDVANVELILAEALNNVVEHAYADGPGPVELLVQMDHRGLSCHIVDKGRPMPSGDAPDPPLPTIDPPDNLPEGGFGWHIIRCLTTDLTYRRDGVRNTLSMLVPLSDFD